MRYALLLAFMLNVGCVGTGEKLSLEIVHETVDGAVDLPYDSPTKVDLKARDEGGAEVNLAPWDVQWESSDSSTLGLRPEGASCWLTATRDFFDTLDGDDDTGDGEEPHATLTVAYGENTAELTVTSVINVSGTWLIIMFPSTALEQWVTVVIEQAGRELTETALGLDIAGSVYGDGVLLIGSDYQLSGTLTSRTSIQGEAIDPAGHFGDWSAQKQ